MRIGIEASSLVNDHPTGLEHSLEQLLLVPGAGLAVVTAVQAFINMGVAVSLLPAKGMTLPFISYGGSSLFSIALTMGFALAVTRQRPRVALTTRDDPSFFVGSLA